nr:MAG TPA: hypothetical protein [Caudoviricetes sp.]
MLQRAEGAPCRGRRVTQTAQLKAKRQWTCR